MKSNFRAIPSIVIQDGLAYVTRQFRKQIYIGDPFNIVRIFNEKYVDEINFVHPGDSLIDLSFLEDLCGEAFMPITYSGGIRNIEDVKAIISCGVDKVGVRSGLIDGCLNLKEISGAIGQQATVLNVDLAQSWRRRLMVMIYKNGKKRLIDFDEYLSNLTSDDFGEVVIRSVRYDGMRKGVDTAVAAFIDRFPSNSVLYSGGINSLGDMAELENKGFVGALAGSFFALHKNEDAVLITYDNLENQSACV